MRPHKKNLPTQKSSPDADEKSFNLCVTVVNSNLVELERMVSGVCLPQTRV